ncbi:hypothetical protein HJC23_012550 [Cyclotella cryptica]|uniref:Uncharacterized protein n=1 Tax=Cyclotella cryptica TaxID=29204 RepID=A0ABD3QRH2_9STRA|eukprot:CCRYP_003204-RA/>CCRYP_003204-RA protein AED:0.37 eAED:0.37 QI:0/-1/0/1/-1/1/1/0/177
MKLPTGSLTCILSIGQVYSSSMDRVAVRLGLRNLEEDCGGGSSGMAWCPELNKCIAPWEETCPISDGGTFSGSSTLLCDAGRCSSDEKCSWTEDTTEFGTFYFNDLGGEFDVPDGCRLNCTGCELVGGNASSTVSNPNPVETLEDTSSSKGFSLNSCTKLILYVTQSVHLIGLFFWR